MKKKLFLLSGVFLFVIFLFAPHAHATTASGYCMQTVERDEIALINSYRASYGLVALKATKTLSASAEHHAQYMVKSSMDVDHTLAGGLLWSVNITNHGYPTGKGMGEDVAAGYQSPSQVLAAWKASPSHNAVLLNKDWRGIGVGRANSSASYYKYYWAANFGTVVDTSTPPLCS